MLNFVISQVSPAKPNFALQPKLLLQNSTFYLSCGSNFILGFIYLQANCTIALNTFCLCVKGCYLGYKLCKNIGVKELKTLLLHRLQNASRNGLGKLQIQTPLDLLLVVVGIHWILSKLLASLFLCVSCLGIESLDLFVCLFVCLR